MSTAVSAARMAATPLARVLALAFLMSFAESRAAQSFAAAQQPAVRPPSVPQALHCSQRSSVAISLAWIPVNGADLYDVSVTSAESRPYAFGSRTSTEPALVFDDLRPSNAYSFAVRAHSSAAKTETYGWSDYSVEMQCKTTEVRLGAAHRLRRIGELATDEIRMRWDAPVTQPLAADGEPTSYTVRYRRQATSVWQHWGRPLAANISNARGHSAWLRSLASAQTYEVQVRTSWRLRGSASPGESPYVDSDVLRLRTAAAGTRWVELFRVSEGGARSTDFLADHNSGDARGDVAFLSTCGTNCGFYDFFASPRVRYCVEMARVSIPHTNTTNGSTAYSDYLSCPGGQPSRYSGPCNCAVWTDRIIAHEPEEQLARFCPAVLPTKQNSSTIGTSRPLPAVAVESEPKSPPAWRACKCANCSMESGQPPTPWAGSLSQRYIGMMPVPLPCTSILAFRQIAGWGPGTYETTLPYGAWYSTPSEGQCAPDQSVGNRGCTWKRDPTAFMVYGEQLLAQGWNLTAPDIRAKDPRGHEWWWVPVRQTEQNRQAMERAFEGLRPRCCGC